MSGGPASQVTTVGFVGATTTHSGTLAHTGQKQSRDMSTHSTDTGCALVSTTTSFGHTSHTRGTTHTHTHIWTPAHTHTQTPEPQVCTWVREKQAREHPTEWGWRVPETEKRTRVCVHVCECVCCVCVCVRVCVVVRTLQAGRRQEHQTRMSPAESTNSARKCKRVRMCVCRVYACNFESAGAGVWWCVGGGSAQRSPLQPNTERKHNNAQ